MTTLYYPLVVCTILVLWLETNGFYEYCRMLGLGRFFKGYKNFIETMAPSTTFVEYLMIKNDCFFVRLISCPICLSVWASVIIALLNSSVWVFFINFYLSLVSYFILKILIKFGKNGT